jgi:hypothetical protein
MVNDEPRDNHIVPGYARDGASLYSHAAMRGRQSKKHFADHDPLSKLVKHERAVIERLERRAAEARANPDPRFPPGRSPTFLGICSRLQKTRVLLTRLEAELRRAAT